MLSDVKDKLLAKIIEINNTGKELIFRAALIPANQESKLSSSVKSLFSGKVTALKVKNQSLIAASLNFLTVNNVMVKSLESTLLLLEPENVLQRGYSITSVNGRILRNSDQVKINDLIDTQLYEGSLRSKAVSK